MRQLVVAMVWVVLAGCATPTAPAAPHRFDPGALKGPKVGTPNEVLVLGTPHLSGLPPAFEAAQLAPLISRLAGWRPQAIAIESLAGPQCAFMRRFPERYAESVEVYCYDPAEAQAATGLDVPAATAEARRLLAGWPEAPSAADRRRLAAVFLAAGEPASALVQWLRLPEAERHEDEVLDAPLVERLKKLEVRRNENSLLAAPLAAALGLERVHAMDDHTTDDVVPDEEAFGKAVMAAWKNPAGEARKAESQALEAQLGTPDGLMALYRAYNAPSMAQVVFESDFGAALEEPSPEGYGRQYVGQWEARNLRMAASIREMVGALPGVRALVIVGASHKGYLEAYLDLMHDVRVADTGPVLEDRGPRDPARAP
ncbi:MAG: hypothetical protein KC933_20830 [Myxococcales bacterium]|nr:hypothetical protein [Myxococcales bacterium]